MREKKDLEGCQSTEKTIDSNKVFQSLFDIYDDILKPSDQYYGQMRKSQWTDIEDRILTHLCKQYGTGKWQAKAILFESRNGKNLRDRWINHLNPGIKRVDWTETEDWLIYFFQRRKGCENKWS